MDEKKPENSIQIETLHDFRKLFLLHFTKELIRHSVSGEVLELKNVLKEKADEEKAEIKKEEERIKQIINPKKDLSILKEPLLKKEIAKPLPVQVIKKPRVLTIPEPKLPSHLSYLKPVPNINKEIDLERLNPLIKDPAVKVIEANPDEKVIVMGTMGRKPTGIVLSKEEIKKIIDKFSQSTKIPVHEGVFRVVVGKLILSAIISDVIGSRFIIKKMIYSPAFRR